MVSVQDKRPTREQLIELAKRDPEAIADLVLMLWDRVDKLEAKVAALERNSRNSSKPPSSDGGNFTNPPKPKSLRGKSGLKPGGQSGHPGGTLRRVDHPDHIVRHRFRTGQTCPKCSHGICAGDDETRFEARQVFELPPITLEVTEHRAQKCVCQGCGEHLTAPFPEDVGAPVQYGPNIQATALYLGGYQLIPYQRLAELFTDLFHCPLSQGTLANFVKRGGQKAGHAMPAIRAALGNAPVLYADETGCRLHGRRHWLHVASSERLTCYHVDEKRGIAALENMSLLENFKGRLMHDFWQSYYWVASCLHLLCNAHLLRELVYVGEELKQQWAQEMIELLLEAKELRARSDKREAGRRQVIGEKTRLRIREKYAAILEGGYKINPEPAPPPPDKNGRRRRGKVARGKALNLLDRLDQRYGEIMGFFENEGVPFDNNQAERDLRMMKTREKISGSFRSDEHARAFCDIRSVISSARKQGKAILGSLRSLVKAPGILGATLAGS